MTGVADSVVDLSPRAERAVARTFMGRFQWQMILIGLGQSVTWMVTLGLVLAGRLSMWVGFPIAFVCCCFAYLPSHEGQHGNLSGRRKGWQWIDPFVGQISLIPLRQSHQVLKVTHMKHHAHTNDPELDVDHHCMEGGFLNAAISVHRGPRAEVLAANAERDPKFAEGVAKGMPMQRLLGGLLLVAVVFFPLKTFFVWWLPSALAQSYQFIYFGWQPHRPGDQVGRYRDTRFWTTLAPRYLFQSMQTHIIHHMYPTIPHWDEPKAMEALRPFIVERGIPGAERIPKRVRFNPLIARDEAPRA
ncbi:MAG: fatty acid desaturase [Actinomycetota bacterium]